MLRKITILLNLVILYLVGSPSFLPVVTSQSQPDFTNIAQYVNQQMRSNSIPGLALAIVKGNQPLYLQGFGQADPQGRPVTPQTPFILGSLSKSFSALALMQLVEQGKVRLDECVEHYLPQLHLLAPLSIPAQSGEPPSPSPCVTLRHLLLQTSGIPQSAGNATGNITTLQERVARLSPLPLAHQPGSAFEYSNANYWLVGAVIEVVSGQSYQTYIQQHIFEPLAMTNSFTAQDVAEKHGLATGYRPVFGWALPATLPYPVDQLPSGYLISSAEDMSHYLITQLNEGHYNNTTLVSAAAMSELHQPDTQAGSSYAMGWFNDTLNNTKVWRHEGTVPNYHSQILIEPQTGWGIVVLANFNNATMPNVLAEPTQPLIEGILTLLHNQTPPAVPTNYWLVFLLFDGVLIGLSGYAFWQLISLSRAVRRGSRTGTGTRREQPPKGRDKGRGNYFALARFYQGPVLRLGLELGLALLVFIGIPFVIGDSLPLPLMAVFQPDLFYWLIIWEPVVIITSLVRFGLNIYTITDLTRGVEW